MSLHPPHTANVLMAPHHVCPLVWFGRVDTGTRNKTIYNAHTDSCVDSGSNTHPDAGPNASTGTASTSTHSSDNAIPDTLPYGFSIDRRADLAVNDAGAC